MKQVDTTSFSSRRFCHFRSLFLVLCLVSGLSSSADAVGAPYLNYNGRYAYATDDMPWAIHRIVDEANQLQKKPYKWGGGHRTYTDRGYDCSGSVSHVLASAGLLTKPLTAKQFERYGDSGPGRYITLFCKGDHVFMSVCGLRFDTSEVGDHRGRGPRWRPESRSMRGFIVRHPRGF